MHDDLIDDDTKKEIIAIRQEAVDFFSSKNKAERELWVANEFLENLGIDFDPSELQPVSDDPPDVMFRDAAFEIKELLEEGRKRHDELKIELNLAANAKRHSDLIAFIEPRDIEYVDVYKRIECEAQKLAESKYPIALRNKMDLLFYVNYVGVFGYVGNPIPNPETLKSQGWRSVSVLTGSISTVLMCQSNGPHELLSFAGKSVKKKR